MAPTFDPLSCADAFDELRTELEQTLSRTDGEVAVGTLLLHIGIVVAEAQTWALEHGAHFDVVDPPRNCDAVHCILVLRRLASDLRGVARRVGLRLVNDNATPGDGET